MIQKAAGKDFTKKHLFHVYHNLLNDNDVDVQKAAYSRWKGFITLIDLETLIPIFMRFADDMKSRRELNLETHLCLNRPTKEK